MRDMFDWIIGTNETALDAAIDGLIALLGACFLTGVLHAVIEAL
jgi:ABC-type multidrug transport system permease subunit